MQRKGLTASDTICRVPTESTALLNICVLQESKYNVSSYTRSSRPSSKSDFLCLSNASLTSVLVGLVSDFNF